MHDRLSIEELEHLSGEELAMLAFKEFRCSSINLDYLKRIIELGCNLEIRDEYGATLLNKACKANYYSEIVELILSKGADINARDEFQGYTALHIAAIYGYNPLARILLEAGADLYAKDNIFDWTPLHCAANYAANWDQYDFIKLLLNHGASKEALDHKGSTPWDLSSERVKELIPELNPNA